MKITNLKKTNFAILCSILISLAACSGGGGGGGGVAAATVVIPGIGAGGSAYVAGTLDGTWTSGCEGGANGDNWSYVQTMTISGNSVVQNNNWYRQNQTCAGAADALEVISFTMAWGNYDTTGYSNNATYSNYSWLITPLTAYGLAKMGNYGVCTSASFSLNVATQCRSSTTGSYKYYLADNIFLPVGQGPNSATSVGIHYDFGTFRKVVSNPSAIDGIYAYTDSIIFTKLIISGDRYAYISADDVNSSRIFVVSGSLSGASDLSIPAGASSFMTSVKSKIWQPRLASGATELNTASPPACGFTDYANGVVKNLLASGTCMTSPTHLMYKLIGSTLQMTFSNLPLPPNFSSGVTLYAPWKL